MSALQIVNTEDGSSTLYNQDLKEHYHSTFGALQESKHVFIQTGLNYLSANLSSINVLEIGFGTGLNAVLTFLWAKKKKTLVTYTGVECFPVSMDTAKSLNYPNLLDVNTELFLKLHFSKDEEVFLSDYFVFKLLQKKIEDIQLPDCSFDLVFFDAFSPDTQPELWTDLVFSKMNKAMKMHGILTTYSTKGIVKRALKSTGFTIEKLPGPPGKREILRATKVTELT